MRHAALLSGRQVTLAILLLAFTAVAVYVLALSL
jgi:hypothetical protein